MQTPQASFFLPCETPSANQRKRLDRFLFLLSALSYQSVTQKPLHKMTFPLPHPPAPFLGGGRNKSEAWTSIWNSQNTKWSLGHKTSASVWLCGLAPYWALPVGDPSWGSLEVHLDSSKSFSWSGPLCELRCTSQQTRGCPCFPTVY